MRSSRQVWVTTQFSLKFIYVGGGGGGTIYLILFLLGNYKFNSYSYHMYANYLVALEKLKSFGASHPASPQFMHSNKQARTLTLNP